MHASQIQRVDTVHGQNCNCRRCELRKPGSAAGGNPSALELASSLRACTGARSVRVTEIRGPVGHGIVARSAVSAS